MCGLGLFIGVGFCRCGELGFILLVMVLIFGVLSGLGWFVGVGVLFLVGVVKSLG